MCVRTVYGCMFNAVTTVTRGKKAIITIMVGKKQKPYRSDIELVIYNFPPFSPQVIIIIIPDSYTVVSIHSSTCVTRKRPN